MTIKIGDTIKLKDTTKKNIVPEGRENNKTAKVLSLLSDIEGGLYLDRDLNGVRYWNIEDVEVVK